MPHVQLSHVSVRYFEYGRGLQVVVSVHGSQASARLWQLVQDARYADRQRTIAVNNRGAGETEVPENEFDFSVDRFASTEGHINASTFWHAGWRSAPPAARQAAVSAEPVQPARQTM